MQRPTRPAVFVSSTWLDLRPEREAVERALQRLRASSFVGMEYFGSRDEDARRASLHEVDRSHVYVGIFAGRYGSGITEDEYRRARELKLPCLVYFKDESTITLDKCEKKQRPRAKLEKLKAELRGAHTVSEFNSPEDLAAKVTADLVRVLKDNPPPPPTPAEAAPAFSALHQLPPPPGDFTGRADELADLSANFERGVQISGLQGQGGIGKTALALKLAEQLTLRYPDAQIYLDLRGADEQQPLSPSDALSHVLRAFHPTAKLPEGEADLRALYLSTLHGQRALLLIDNARDAAQVQPLIPPAGCVLLITSRQHFTLPGLYAKDLNTLPPDDARALLLNIATRIGDHADEIARLCGYLPLALRLAASTIAERKNLNPKNYVRRLSDARQRLGLVEASIKLSYDLLSTKMQRRWRTLAVFPATFDDKAAAAVWETESDAAQDALGELIKYSLLNWDYATARYNLHDLARLFADSRLSDAERYAAQARHATHYVRVLREADNLYKQGGEAFMRGLALFDAEVTNIQAGQAWATHHADSDDAVARLCFGYPDGGAYVLHLRLHPQERVNWSERALVASQKVKDRLAEGRSLGNLGNAYIELGEARRAVEFYEQVLVIMRETGDRRTEGNTLGNLGSAYAELGEARRAIELYEQRLIIARETGNRRGQGNTLNNLGSAYFELGETRRAVELYEQALAVHREIGDRRSEGHNLWNMSLALDNLGDQWRAVVCAEAALKIFEEIEDPNVGMVREALEEWRGETG